MKAERGVYDCGHVSVTTARPARSKNWYKTKLENEIVFSRRRSFFLARELDGFHSLSLLVESKLSLTSC